MIEWINNFFGIKNEVSVPTFISIVVFFSGGFINYLLTILNSYSSRRSVRKTFYLVTSEIIANLKVKEKQALRFYPTIKPAHDKGWVFPYTSVSYLETLFELDFNEIYYSFRKRNDWSFCNKNIKNKAFHRIWATLRNLRFLETKLEKDLENMMLRFDVFHKEYNVKLEEYRKYHDSFCREIYGQNIDKSNSELIIFLESLSKIWYDWLQMDETKRTAYFITHDNLVKPILELNQLHKSINLTAESTNLLLACSFQYIEMVNVLNLYNYIFKNYYRDYRESNIILAKCISILKK